MVLVKVGDGTGGFLLFSLLIMVFSLPCPPSPAFEGRSGGRNDDMKASFAGVGREGILLQNKSGF